MDFERAKRYLENLGQEHLLEYYDELTDGEKCELLQDIENANFNILRAINNKDVVKKQTKFAPIAPLTLKEIEARKASFEKVGLDQLTQGKVAAVLLAGGQGSRLGFNGPKGTFDIGISHELSIFGQQMANIFDVTSRTCRHFAIFVMTSCINHAETVKFFKEHDYFGYPRDRIFFYIQDVAPSCDFDGKVFLREKHRLSVAPNGNGGWYSSLINSGLGRVIERENIEWLNVYSVDNVLQRICDPVFIGATILKRCSCGAKVVKKVNPDEKVGLLCLENGKPSVVEYYEMPESLQKKRKKGDLIYANGVTLNYLFNVHELSKTLYGKLPYHLAEKQIPHVENGEIVYPTEPNGYKFETLVVDMVKLMSSCLAFEVEREKEFAPIKNLEGADSVDSARELLRKNGVEL